MITLALLLTAAITVPGLAGLQAATAEAPAQEPDLAEAERLFNQGLARYESADYEGAIESFTLALSEVRDQGVDDFGVLGPMLYNIGLARVHAYEIDRNVEHLRQAQAIFSRLLDGAESFPDEVDADDLADARTQLEQIRAKLDELETEDDPPPPEPTPAGEPTATPATDDGQRAPAATRARRLGAGLTAGGVALLGGGVGMLVWGLGYGRAAQAQVDAYADMGVPADHPVFDEGAQFVADEKRKGTTWIAVGGAAAALGVAGIATGIAQLLEAKRLEQSNPVGVTAMIGPEGLVFGIHGRF